MRFDKLKNFLDGLEDTYGIPAYECRVMCGDEAVFDYKHGTDGRSMYYIYSMTKMVTCVAAMRLIEQGKLSLEDNVEKYLPEFAEITVKKEGKAIKAKNKLTVGNLLAMQGGFNYDIDTEPMKELIGRNPGASTREVMTAFAKTPLEFEPGEGFSYSLCYDVLGGVIEAASGMNLGEFFGKEIFEPLGMKDTSFNISEKNAILPLYKFNPETGKTEKTEKKNMYIFTPQYESGGAGLISTFEDYSKFVYAITNGGIAENGYSLLETESIEEIRKERMNKKMLDEYHRYPQWGCTYAFGVRVMKEAEICGRDITLGSFELTGAAGSYAVFDVERKISILYFQHVLDVVEIPEYVHHKIRDLVYEEMKDK